MESRVCIQCGAGIILSRSHARFCSTKCRVYWNRAKNRVPVELTSSARWIRRTAAKVPRTVNDTPASSTDPSTWATYDAATASTVGAGLGFVLNGDGIACIDLDHCITAGKPSAAALAVLDRFPGAWVEVSPSGDGLHVWGLAAKRKGWRKTIDGLQVEFYTTGRYMTVSGNTFRPGRLVNLESINDQ
jgi:primase-polymerase (primpol)-like protein